MPQKWPKCPEIKGNFYLSIIRSTYSMRGLPAGGITTNERELIARSVHLVGVPRTGKA